MLDIVVAAAVDPVEGSEPPTSPETGAAYLVPSGATGAWAGKDRMIASATSGGWRFVDPVDGVEVLCRWDGTRAVFREGAWSFGDVRASRVSVDGKQVVGAQAAPIAEPAGGATVDTEARQVVGLMLAAMRRHGLIAQSA